MSKNKKNNNQITTWLIKISRRKTIDLIIKLCFLSATFNAKSASEIVQFKWMRCVIFYFLAVFLSRTWLTRYWICFYCQAKKHLKFIRSDWPAKAHGKLFLLTEWIFASISSNKKKRLRIDTSRRQNRNKDRIYWKKSVILFHWRNIRLIRSLFTL